MSRKGILKPKKKPWRWYGPANDSMYTYMAWNLKFTQITSHLRQFIPQDPSPVHG